MQNVACDLEIGDAHLQIGAIVCGGKLPPRHRAMRWVSLRGDGFSPARIARKRNGFSTSRSFLFSYFRPRLFSLGKKKKKYQNEAPLLCGTRTESGADLGRFPSPQPSERPFPEINHYCWAVGLPFVLFAPPSAWIWGQNLLKIKRSFCGAAEIAGGGEAGCGAACAPMGAIKNQHQL